MLLNVILDSLPIVIAIYALLNMPRVVINNAEVVICKILCILMILCQSIWIQTYMSGFSLILPIINKLWDVFNLLSMVLIVILFSRYNNDN